VELEEAFIVASKLHIVMTLCDGGDLQETLESVAYKKAADCQR
jgi:hypothetical protein